MTAPFDPEVMVQLDAWLNGKPVPEVAAVRIPCASKEEWLAARRGTIGASDLPILQGLSSFSSPYSLFYQKRYDWRIPETAPMHWGSLVEPVILQLFREARPDLFIAAPIGAPWSLWRHPWLPWATATPDALVVDDQGRVSPVEIKSYEGGEGWGEVGSADVPPVVRAQATWQAVVLLAEGAWVVRHRASGRGRLAWYWIPLPKRGVVAGMIEEASAFLESIAADQPPEPDASRATTETLKQQHPAIDSGDVADIPLTIRSAWLNARTDKRAAEKAERYASNLLRQHMGRAEYAAFGGQVFAKRRMGKRSGYSVPPTTTDELREVTDGQRETAGDLPVPEPGNDGPQAPTVDEEEPIGVPGPGGPVGDGDRDAEAQAGAGDDPGGPEVEET